MITTIINMPPASLYIGESFKCEKTGVELIKYTPKININCKLSEQYILNDGNRDYALPEEIFNIIKNLMI
jgi:hypothetical protein